MVVAQRRRGASGCSPNLPLRPVDAHTHVGSPCERRSPISHGSSTASGALGSHAIPEVVSLRRCK
jgi:hypothetical protein